MPVIAVSSSAVITLTLLIVAGAAGLVVYFLPSLVARSRQHYNRTAIYALNLFLGWTFLGWVVALVMAFSVPAPRD